MTATQVSATTAVALILVVLPTIASGQGRSRSADEPCLRARPAPECKVFFLTNAGGYLKPASGPGSSRLRAVVDWGVMVNVGRRGAIGGSWFVSLDEDDFTTGPALRYRHWFAQRGSLDVAIGTPAAGGQNFRSGSILGLVKYNPVHWFGVSVRPEYVRRTTYDPTDFTPHTTGSGRLYAGAEFGGVPGLALSLGGGVALGVLIVLFAVAGGID